MQVSFVPFAETQAFSDIFLDYIQGKAALKPFYGRAPQLESFAPQIEEKLGHEPSVKSSQRAVLQAVLEKQYQGYENYPETQIQSLASSKTFTITTGHQLNLCTGPLYFIYKIISVIQLSRRLKEQYPAYNFIPLYWMASEDHDFAEINHFRLFGKKFSWESSQEGAVGHFKTEGILEVLKEIGEVPKVFKEAYESGVNLAQATHQLVHQLFHQEGLLCLDADDPQLKAAFAPIMKEDIFEGKANIAVEAQSEKLAQLEYKTQVYPREINFFYLHEGIRARIVREGAHFKVLNHDIQFSKEELEAEMEAHPERFSPNVVMRPLYQEYILPNLAYLGGPGELAYWLQLKGVFESYQVPFPILMPRNFALYISKNLARKVEKLDLDIAKLFKEFHQLKKEFLLANSEANVSLGENRKALSQVFAEITDKVKEVDPTLEGFVGAEHNKAQKSLQNIEKRLQKAEEKRQEIELKQLESLKEKLFPGGNLQERSDNVLNFLINQPSFIQDLIPYFDPFRFEMMVLQESN